MTATVGIIANPASGKDIRRLVAHGSVFDNNEKVNIIRRVLRGLDSLGVARALAMPDAFGLAPAAYEKADVGLDFELLDMPLQHGQADSTRAARLMAAAGVGCIVTLGGDGTNRVVAKGCGYVPLVPISTGTNNVFPVMVEGTLAGLAAGVVALKVPGVRKAAVRMARRLDILSEGRLVDIALVDVVAYDERFTASRAIWEADKMRTVILSRVQAGSIGASAVAGYLPQAAEARGRGAWLELGKPKPEDDDSIQRVQAPIAPGLIRPLSVRSLRWLGVGEGGTIAHTPTVLALDGEREIGVQAGRPVEVRLSQNGPHVVDVLAALRAAGQAGVFVR